jgi:hypothetical protein
MISKIYKKLNWSLNKLKEINLTDSSNRLIECDVLFFCHDANRPIVFEKKAYSPLVDSVREIIESAGLKCLTIAHPFSKMVSEKAGGEVICINRYYFFY